MVHTAASRRQLAGVQKEEEPPARAPDSATPGERKDPKRLSMRRGYPLARIGLDGTEYEIDLNAGHARQLRDALALYVGAARRVGGSARKPARGNRPGPSGVLNTTDVREWARAQGIEVTDRGRVPADLVAKFKAATGQEG